MFREVNIGSAVSRLCLGWLAMLAGLLTASQPAFGSWARLAPRSLPAASQADSLGWLDARRPLTSTTWLFHYLLESRHLSIEEGTVEVVLERFRRPWVSGLTDFGWYARGRYGPRHWRQHLSLGWTELACGLDTPDAPQAWGPLFGAGSGGLKPPPNVRLQDAWLAMALVPEPDALHVTTRRVCPSSQQPRPVLVMRAQGEYDRFHLLGCDGSVSADSLDRFSVLMRPTGVPRPELPLPLEPQAGTAGEWLDGIKLAHPRLLWAVQRIAQAFPGRAIILMSGYRREAHGYHPRGRAVDVTVHGIDNALLFEYCRTLNDVGCGFYPN